MTLAEAPSKRAEAKRGIAVGIAPKVAKREEKLALCPHCRISLPRIFAERSDAANQSETKGTEEIRAQEIERYQRRNFIQKLAVRFVRVTRA